MNDLEAIKWIMAQDHIILYKDGATVYLETPEHSVVSDTMIKCVIKLKALIDG